MTTYYVPADRGDLPAALRWHPAPPVGAEEVWYADDGPVGVDAAEGAAYRRTRVAGRESFHVRASGLYALLETRDGGLTVRHHERPDETVDDLGVVDPLFIEQFGVAELATVLESDGWAVVGDWFDLHGDRAVHVDPVATTPGTVAP